MVRSRRSIPAGALLATALLLSATGAWTQSRSELREALARERLQVIAKALVVNDAHAVLRAMDPSHLLANVVLLPGFDLDDVDSVDLAVTAWALVPARGTPFLTSIWQIESVDEVTLDTAGEVWTASFLVTLGSGALGEYRTFMDPQTLLIFGASG